MNLLSQTAKRGGVILQLGLLEGSARRRRLDALAEDDHALARTDNATLEHDVLLIDNTIVSEATHGGDVLLSEIGLSRRVVGDLLAALINGSLTDAVHLLVHLCAVVEPELTSASDRAGDASRMPGTDTSDLADTLVSLAGELRHAETGDDALDTMAAGEADDVDVVVGAEHGLDGDELLKEALGEIDLLRDVAAIDLDLSDVRLLLAEVELRDLGVRNDADDLAVLLDALELLVEVLGASSLTRVLGEGLLLGLEPVLVKTATEVVAELLSPDGSEGAEATRSDDVANDTDNDDLGALKNGDGLNSLLLVHLCCSVSTTASRIVKYWSQASQPHGRRGSCRPCKP